MPRAATEIDHLLRRATETGAIPGVVAMATDGRDTLYQGAAGVCSLGSSLPMAVDSVFWIASMTKAITAACCMQLVEQGRVGLDDDAGRLLPALAKPRVLTGFDAAGKPQLRPARRAITLRRLLTHTAGFSYDMWNADMLRYAQFTGLPRAATFQKPEDCLPLAFDPGEAWSYGVGIDWAGKVLEVVTGETLDHYMQRHVCQPLGMHSTGFALKPGIGPRLAGMHQRHPDGRLEAVPYDPPQDPAGFLGGGGLYGTAGDYITFIRMLLAGGSLGGVRILKPETVALMGRSHTGEVDVQPMPSALPLLTNDANFFPGQRQKWGLSFLINTQDVPGRRAGGSLCWGGLRNTYFWLDPKRGVGGTLMTQILPFVDAPVMHLYEDFERAVYAMGRE